MAAHFPAAWAALASGVMARTRTQCLAFAAWPPTAPPGHLSLEPVCRDPCRGNRQVNGTLFVGRVPKSCPVKEVKGKSWDQTEG